MSVIYEIFFNRHFRLRIVTLKCQKKKIAFAPRYPTRCAVFAGSLSQNWIEMQSGTKRAVLISTSHIFLAASWANSKERAFKRLGWKVRVEHTYGIIVRFCYIFSH